LNGLVKKRWHGRKKRQFPRERAGFKEGEPQRKNERGPFGIRWREHCDNGLGALTTKRRGERSSYEKILHGGR